jgi:hypothetical protein
MAGWLRSDWSRPLLSTFLLLAVYLGYEAWLSAGGARKLTADELPGGAVQAGQMAPRAHYEVVLDFKPEAFHITRVQAVGRVIEVRGNTILTMDMASAEAQDLARQYWVADMRRWKGL